MTFLHRENIIHGNLTTTLCMIDCHWTIKIAGWEYPVIFDIVRKTKRNRSNQDADRSILHYLFADATSSRSTAEPERRHVTSADCRFCVAPELYRNEFSSPTRAGDVYSFGLVVDELFTVRHQLERGGRSAGETMASPSHVEAAIGGERDDTTAAGGCNREMSSRARQVVTLACCQDAIKRPTFEHMERSLRAAITDGKGTLTDRLAI